MSVSQTAIGIGVLTAVGTLFLQSVLPGPVPLTVNSLTYTAGLVYQDRTVITDGTAFYAQWSASVVDVDTGEVVPWCSGSGSFPYQPGHKIKEFPLADWVGNATCTPESLNPGTYVLQAAWQWGADQTSKTSDPFEVVE